MSGASRSAAPGRTLAIDVGGTKIAAALVEGGRILDRRETPTPAARDPDIWLDAMCGLARGWTGYGAVGAAVTGLVRDGLWTALNPAILPIRAGFPLVARLGAAFGVPALAVNDAQAAAWGEWRAAEGGAGAAGALLFVTVSTGIGGGAVIDGRLLGGDFGAAGSIGHVPVAVLDGRRCGCGGIGCAEAEAAGSALAQSAAARLGHPCTVPDLFARAAVESWAEALIDRSARLVAAAIAAGMRVIDPSRVVMGGGIGLRADYRARVAGHLAAQDPAFAARLGPARLGADAGLIGAAALALAD